MTQESVIGIDIGTASTKGLVATADGTVLARRLRPHRVSFPGPGRAEHDAEATWWADVVAVCRELAPAAGAGLRGVCVSGIGPCVVPCDEHLRPLRPAILYGIDTRAACEIDEIERLLGAEAILARGGSALSAQALGPKLLWLRRHEPEVWSATHGWYMASSFAAARLTGGAYVLDHHSASQCDPFYDLTVSAWTDDWIREFLPDLRLPELVWPGSVIGTVTPEVARETGLPSGTPVTAGTVDAWAEALSAGVRDPGDLMVMYGSTMFFVQVVRDAAPNEVLWTTRGVTPGSTTIAGGMSTSGSLTEWIRELTGGGGWMELLASAASTPPGARGLLLLPYFAGERTPINDPRARGVLAGLTLTHGPGELLRAAYEATAFGTRQILNAFQAAGHATPRLVAVGGGTQSELWLQIVSDVTGLRQEIPRETVGASYGSALLAAIGAALAAPGAHWAQPTHVVAPDPRHAETYDRLYESYLDLYGATASIVHRLADLATA